MCVYTYLQIYLYVCVWGSPVVDRMTVRQTRSPSSSFWPVFSPLYPLATFQYGRSTLALIPDGQPSPGWKIYTNKWSHYLYIQYGVTLWHCSFHYDCIMTDSNSCWWLTNGSFWPGINNGVIILKRNVEKYVNGNKKQIIRSVFNIKYDYRTQTCWFIPHNRCLLAT